MGTWVRADYQFGDHFTVFVIPARRGDAHGDAYGVAIDTILNGLGEWPGNLEAFLYDTVISARPELVGCVIWSLNFSPKLCAWEIAVSHASLPRVRVFEEAETQWLKYEPR